MSKLRLDRSISMGIVHPVARLLNGCREPRVPILMYHGICSDSFGGHPYFETNTSPELFAQHMRFLCENGYSTVDLKEALEVIMTGRNDHKQVAITFDDGFRDFYTQAFPILARYGFKATMFIVSDRTKSQSVCRDGKQYLTWQDVRELHSYGIRIGSHTVSHPELYKLSCKELEYQVRESKEVIEDQLGESIQSFSYPYAFPEHDKNFVERLKGLLLTHGYENGVSTILGTASREHDWFFLPRLPVNSYDDLRFLKAKLEGGYDWLHKPQYIFKAMKTFRQGRAKWH